jgi:hypothetical protein
MARAHKANTVLESSPPDRGTTIPARSSSVTCSEMNRSIAPTTAGTSNSKTAGDTFITLTRPTIERSSAQWSARLEPTT